jgi:hypothetical protein
MKSIAVTMTTINVPIVIDSILKQFEKYGTSNYDVDFIIIGDVKTPSGTANYIQDLKNKKYKQNFIYFDIDEQKKVFSKYDKLWNHLPLNSFARRNFADLFAYINNYDVIIRIDDDNYPILENNFFQDHSSVGSFNKMNIINSDSGWFNICQLLSEENNIQFYPRGFPFTERWKKSVLSQKVDEIKVVVNAGLWLGDPDVDALTRLTRPVNAINYINTYGNTFALDNNTWSPINTQNTSFARETIPAAFVSPFAGRYDDILSGYFLRKITDHLGDYVSYGKPLMNQIRNEHNLWHDLDKERIGGSSIHLICDILKEIELSSSSYLEAYKELILKFDSINSHEVEFYKKITEGMSIWAETFEKI